MRCARSYSIIDHELLHAGHLGRLSHEALSLYLFFVVVGNYQGRSFYRPDTIGRILRLCPDRYRHAKGELLRAGLVRDDDREVRVMNLSPRVTAGGVR